MLHDLPREVDRAIAERTGLSAKTVGKVRTDVSGDVPHHRLGRDGRLRPVSSIEGRRSAAALLTAEPEISLRELSRRTGLSVGTVRDVRDRLGRGLSLPPVPEPAASRGRAAGHGHSAGCHDDAGPELRTRAADRA